MKLNKTLMLAAIAVGGLLAGIPVQAQDASNQPAATPPPMRRPAMNADGLAKQLDLTDDQKTKVKPVLDDMQKQQADLRNDTSLSRADQMTKRKEIRDAASAKLKEILTPEQYAKWEKMGPGNRRPGAPGAPAAPATPPADTAPKN